MGKGRGELVVLTALLVVGFAHVVAADDAYPKSYLDGASRKLGRGLSNVLTAPLEVIRTPSLTGEREGGVAALTVGVVQGVGNMLVRELAGIYEVATFYVAVPKQFQPILQPEFVFAHGDWTP